MVGLKEKSADEIKKAFNILDADNSGYIEEEELKWDKHTQHSYSDILTLFYYNYILYMNK